MPGGPVPYGPAGGVPAGPVGAGGGYPAGADGPGPNLGGGYGQYPPNPPAGFAGVGGGPRPPKKSHAGLIAGIVVAALVVVGGGGYGLYRAGAASGRAHAVASAPTTSAPAPTHSATTALAAATSQAAAPSSAAATAQAAAQPSLGPTLDVKKALGSGWEVYDVIGLVDSSHYLGYAAEGGELDVYTYKYYAKAHKKSAVVAEVSIEDNSVVWKADTAKLCGGAPYCEVSYGRMLDAGRVVLDSYAFEQQKGKSHYCVVTLGADGSLLSQRDTGKADSLLAATGDTVVIGDYKKSVAGYKTTDLSTPVWTVPWGTWGTDTLWAGGAPAYVLAQGGYRDIETGRPAGFGGGTEMTPGVAHFEMTGGQLFRFEEDDDTSAKDPEPLTVSAWSATADKALWGAPVPVPYLTTLNVAGGQVVLGPSDDPGAGPFTGAKSVSAYSIATGVKSWEYTPSDGSRVMAVVAASGTADPSGANSGTGTGPAAAGGTSGPAFIVTDKDAVVWLDAATGRPLARIGLPETTSDPYMVATATGVALVADGTLVEAASAGGGRITWTHPLPAGLRKAYLATSGGRIFVEALTDGNINDVGLVGNLGFRAGTVAELNQ
ncbi:MAG: PQQ-like beta-propeller repeat protein [Bifidobacteriaceae bacterium]|jgi:hypothetical protein|nr:PQQ-like beta-propeller repeat protein [Bifidobacteriaceae bacterium]